MSEYVECVAKVTLTAEDPLCGVSDALRRSMESARRSWWAFWPAWVSGSICGRYWTATIRRRA